MIFCFTSFDKGGLWCTLRVPSDLEQVDDPGEAEDVGDGKETFRDEGWVVGRPVLAHHLSVAIPARLDLEVGDNSEGKGGQVKGEHHEVQPVPPLPDVGFDALLPQLFTFGPNEPWRDTNKHDSYDMENPPDLYPSPSHEHGRHVTHVRLKRGIELRQVLRSR